MKTLFTVFTSFFLYLTCEEVNLLYLIPTGICCVMALIADVAD